MSDPNDKIAEIEARRAARKAALEVEQLEQRAIDLEALDALETEHGDNRVARYDVTAYVKGLPTLAVVRTPSEAETKRYSARIKLRTDGELPDLRPALVELADSCVIYPDKEKYEQLVKAVPGLKTALGGLASQLATGKRVEQGKG